MDIWARPWRRAFDFKGRATRREYWLFWVQILIAFFLYFFMIGLLAPVAEGEAFAVAIALTAVAGSIFLLIATTSALVRRLHDHDKSGWMALLTLVPAVGWIFFLIMTLTPGTNGENDYGFDPRAGDRPSTDELASVFS